MKLWTRAVASPRLRAAGGVLAFALVPLLLWLLDVRLVPFGLVGPEGR
jgi:hypothetical protein